MPKKNSSGARPRLPTQSPTEDRPRALRERWLTKVRERFSLRLHMSLILLVTTSAGVATNWFLLFLGLDLLSLRMVLAVPLTYLFFIALVRLWLRMMDGEPEPAHAALNLADGIDLFNGGGSSAASEMPVPFVGQGGQFAGAGAQASFDTSAVAEASAAPSGASGGGGIDIDVPGLDSAGFILLCLFVLLLCSFVVAGGYLIYEAPVILAETLFEFSLATALLRKLRKSEPTDWMGHLFKLTWKPMAGVVLATLLFAGAVEYLRPNAVRLHDLWHAPTENKVPSVQP